VARRSRYDQWLLDALGDGLGLYWPLDDSIGSATARDASNNGRPGDYEGVVELEQQSIVRGLQPCMKGDGASGTVWYEQADAGDVWPGESDWTMMFWSQIGQTSERDFLFQFGYRENTSNIGAGNIQYHPAIDAIRFNVNRAGGITVRANIASPETFHGPHLYVMRWTDATDTLKTWYNLETASGSHDSDTSPIQADDQWFVLGGTRFGTNPTNGRMQHCAIWPDRALTNSEIQAVYEQGVRFWDSGRLL
jgi:hypothetical protein